MSRPYRIGLRRALSAALAAMALLATPASGAAKKLFVQKRDGQIGSGDGVSVKFAKATKPGNLIVAFVVWDNGDPVSVTDSSGNTYASAVGPTQAGGDSLFAEIFYARNIAGGADTVTASFETAIGGHAALYVHEYSGLGRMLPLDTAIAASGSGTLMDSNTLTTHSTSELLFVGAVSNGASVGQVTRGFKLRGRRRGELTAELVAPDVGSQRVTALQSGAAWALQVVAFTYVGDAPVSPRFPLGVGASGRYLVDQADAPFLMTGDSPQALMVNLSESQAAAFFANRRKRGFNSVWINLLCSTYTGGRPDGSTYDGILPFNNGFDLSQPNESYFARVDAMLRLAAQNGLLVLLDPAETGSFLSVLTINGVDTARGYGRYLGTRYRGFDNILWMSGNDFQDYTNAESDAAVQAVARGIQDTDAAHIHTVELNLVSSLEDPSWEPLIQLNATYTYDAVFANVLEDYNRPEGLPTFMVESNYEFELAAANEPTPEILRRQAYWSLLSGATGQFYGNHYTWQFISGWQKHLDTPGSTQMGYVPRLFGPRAWYDLVPDQSHSVVTAGYGDFGNDSPGGSDYLTAGRTPEGSLVIAYLPTVRTITVDMTELSGAATASWYDPSRGAFARIAGSPFANTGSRDFTPPGRNRDGDGDWLLVLEAPH